MVDLNTFLRCACRKRALKADAPVHGGGRLREMNCFRRSIEIYTELAVHAASIAWWPKQSLYRACLGCRAAAKVSQPTRQWRW